MDLQARKLNLIQFLTQTKNTSLIGKFENIIKKQSSVDFWDTLSNKEQQEIELGIKELDNGEVVSYKDVMSKHRK
tara:strand:- start:152 stop:376 length:225 start_codon:yes stop_codon:yes gene_type:complete